jgi:hypothetical protein
VPRAATDSLFTNWDGSLIQEALSADTIISGMASVRAKGGNRLAVYELGRQSHSGSPLSRHDHFRDGKRAL